MSDRRAANGAIPGRGPRTAEGPSSLDPADVDRDDDGRADVADVVVYFPALAPGGVPLADLPDAFTPIRTEWYRPKATARGSFGGKRFVLLEPVTWTLPQPWQVGLDLPDLPTVLRFCVTPAGYRYDFATMPRGALALCDLFGIYPHDLAPMATHHDPWQPGEPLRLAHPEVTEAEVNAAAKVVALCSGMDPDDAAEAHLAITGNSLTRSPWFAAVAKTAPWVARRLARRLLLP